MRVCTCCYNPEVIDGQEFAGVMATSGYIVVPDTTPRIIGGGVSGSDTISHEVLEAAGLTFGLPNCWLKPNRELIFSVYDISGVNGGREFEAWERQLLEPGGQIIAFLTSSSADKSTLGTGIHLKRKARLLAVLFQQYVLGGTMAEVTPYAYSGEFSGTYGSPAPVELGSSSQSETESKEQIKAAIRADQQKLADWGVSPEGSDERAVRYCHKLYRSLWQNLDQLNLVVGFTETSYAIHSHTQGRANIGLLSAIVRLRNGAVSSSLATLSIYKVMLPILLPKLIEAGYPDTGVQIEWEYEVDVKKERER